MSLLMAIMTMFAFGFVLCLRLLSMFKKVFIVLFYQFTYNVCIYVISWCSELSSIMRGLFDQSLCFIYNYLVMFIEEDYCLLTIYAFSLSTWQLTVCRFDLSACV